MDACGFSQLVVIFVMDETKGKALDVVQGGEKSEKIQIQGVENKL